MSRILVSGSLAYDRIMEFPGHFKENFLPDKLRSLSVSFNVGDVSENFGGCAGNVAYNLALLGLEPRIIATAGSDFGRYRDHLDGNGINPTSIHIAANGLTASAYVISDTEGNQIAAFSVGAGGMPYLAPPSIEGAACALIGAGCLEDMRSLPAYYREAQFPYMFDPGQSLPVLTAEDLRGGIEGAAVVFGNEYELGLIAAKTGLDEGMICTKAAVLVVTYGAKGSRVMTRKGEVTVPVVAVQKAVDQTGAGDAYRAGFIAGYLKGLPPETCAKIASAVAAYAVEKRGTQNHRFTMAELAERYTKSYGETLSL
jgi:adenosine kinase